MDYLIKKPSAWIPILMSLAAFTLLISYLIIFGFQKQSQEDEGTAAHLFQILMGGQVFIITFFLINWLPKRPREALLVLALQIITAFFPFALLFYFEHLM